MLGELVEALLTQIFEVVLMALLYFTGTVVIAVISFGQLHVDFQKDDASDAVTAETSGRFRVIYHKAGKRYAADWVVYLLGVIFWVGLALVLIF